MDEYGERPEPPTADRLPAWVRDARSWVRRHQVTFWWLHSVWALVWGLAFVWLGTRQFSWLRIAFAYFAFIWVTSALLPLLADWPRVSPGRRTLIRTAVNYVNRNFYQQLLFFVLPVYAASMTWGSPNVLFVVLVAAAAVVSTLDLVYDRHVSVKPGLAALFFGLNLFICLNVALPILWSVSNRLAMRISGALALVGFVSLRFRPRHFVYLRVRVALLVTAALLWFFIEWGRPIVPPAPLRLVSVQFGRGIDRRHFAVVAPVAEISSGFTGRIYGLSAISAPLGLEDRVRHRWVAGSHELYRSPYYSVIGGRTQGFRLWTSASIANLIPGPTLDLWVETEGGQVIGRAQLPVTHAPGS